MRMISGAHRLVAGSCAVLLVIAVLLLTRHSGGFVVTAEFAKTPGLYPGNDVVVLGVRVGTVTDVEPRGRRVLVTMRLDDDVRLPARADAVLLPRSVVTDRVVELTPTYAGGAELGDGDRIPVARTRTPVEFGDLVASVSNLSAQLGQMEKGSNAIDDFMTVAAGNAQGNGRRLAATLHGLQAVLGGFAENSGDTVALVRRLSDLTHFMAQNDATIRSFSSSLTDASALVAGEAPAIDATLSALVSALGDVASFASQHKRALSNEIADLGQVAGVLGRRSRDLAETLDEAPLLLQNVVRAIDPVTRRFRVRLDLQQSVVRTSIFAGFCKLYTQLPACDQLHLDLGSDPGADLGLTELLTGSHR